ncbi:HAMP domain-containing sensor histidine kinase [Nocardioides sp. SYSU D00038]|uniref:sensor histidine kinase n=1 Tax=Nocardioides sp. SYSU D00038 TaxID=2812554 RepID=UPI0027DAE1A5|nr:HAMP domain-containing sensor histidine kinase [Nocardioides sp. SYSU D00038]
MSTPDLLEVAVVSAVAALVVGVLGLGTAWLLRRRTLRWQLGVVAVVAVVGTWLGVLAIAQRMFLSTHDLEVVTTVASTAGVVSLLVAVALGQAVVGWSESLRRAVSRVGGGTGERDGDRGAVGSAEFRRLSEELDLARARLEEAHHRERRLEESRRELVSWVSHDLRTPLAGLRAMTEALDDGLAADPERYRHRIAAEVDRMTTMVDDLFELSRIHAGVLTLSPEPLDLNDVVSEAVAGADPVARARGVRLDGGVEPGVEVVADPAGLSRVVTNLLVNAIRHTPPDGLVEVTGRAVPDGVELSVSDGCGGIPDDDLPRLFDVAFQGGPARTPDETGTRGAGLGLAIVRGIVEAHRGRVEVENLEPATGCRFRVRLPHAVS